jgi:hypothetical protein
MAATALRGPACWREVVAVLSSQSLVSACLERRCCLSPWSLLVSISLMFFRGRRELRAEPKTTARAMMTTLTGSGLPLALDGHV